MGHHAVKKISRYDVYRKYCFDELSREINREDSHSDNKDHKFEELEKRVDSLSDSEAKKLCKDLSHSRKNPVYAHITGGPRDWCIDSVKISMILMIGINRKVNRYLSEHYWSLRDISKDKRIIKHKEFRKKGDIHPKCMTLIAHKIDGHRFKLIDGNHRAVQLAINGEKEIKLIHY